MEATFLLSDKATEAPTIVDIVENTIAGNEKGTQAYNLARDNLYDLYGSQVVKAILKRIS